MGRGMKLAAGLACVAAAALLGCVPEDGGTGAGGAVAALQAAVSGAGSDEIAPESREEKVVYYRYVDESGSVRFVERREEVPKEQREGAAIEWKVDRSPASSPPPSGSGWQRVTRALGERLASRDVAEASAARGSQPQVVVYTTSWCGWCRKTLAHLDRNGIDYQNLDIERDRSAYDALRRKTGSTGVPVLEIDGELVIGFDRNRIDRLLGL